MILLIDPLIKYFPNIKSESELNKKLTDLKNHHTHLIMLINLRFEILEMYNGNFLLKMIFIVVQKLYSVYFLDFNLEKNKEKY